MGPIGIKDITKTLVIDTIKAIEATGSIDLSRRMKIIASQIFGFAIGHEWISIDPSHGITAVLARRPKKKHRASLAASELPEFQTS